MALPTIASTAALLQFPSQLFCYQPLMEPSSSVDPGGRNPIYLRVGLKHSYLLELIIKDGDRLAFA